MSFYRSLLAAVAAIVIASPVFAEEAVAPEQAASSETLQVADNSGASTPDATTQQTTSTDQQATDQEKVNLNKATVKQLVKVKGINASKARSIVAYRKKHGDFKSTDDLSNVKGFKKMKPDMLKEITDQLSVE
jgi:competence protein ComEA